MADSTPETRPVFSLPKVEKEVLDSFEHHLPDLEQLYKQLRAENPYLAFYIVRRTEELAPQDPANKRRIAQLALELAGILSAQQAINGFRETFDFSDLISLPSAGERDGGEVQPPEA